MKVDPVVVLVLSLVFIFSVVALHSMFGMPLTTLDAMHMRMLICLFFRSHCQAHSQVFQLNGRSFMRWENACECTAFVARWPVLRRGGNTHNYAMKGSASARSMRNMTATRGSRNCNTYITMSGWGDFCIIIPREIVLLSTIKEGYSI